MNSALMAQWKSLSESDSDFLVNCSQFCAFMMQQVDHISWAGFYWHRQQKLIVGAYQGPVACTRIALDKGVCGAAFTTAKTQLIADVNQFEGHIACDTNAASEVVVPIFKDGQVVGVFDIDSYILDRFDEDFATVLEQLLTHFAENTVFPANLSL